MTQRIVISPLMRRVTDCLKENCEGVNFCLTEKGENLIVEVAKSDVEKVIKTLQDSFPNVAPMRLASAMMPYLHQFILVKPMVTESPVVSVDGTVIPTIEKILVDQLSDKEYADENVAQKKKRFLQTIETYSVHLPRLLRYAARKGKKEEVESMLKELNKERVSIIRAIQECLAQSPVIKAWVFGSYARMEERKDSDIDILVSLDQNAHMGLLAFSELALKMEAMTGKRIDLVVDKTVKPFAQKSIQNDKVLIYERAS